MDIWDRRNFEGLEAEDVVTLQSMSGMLDYFAELSQAEIFIDCINRAGTRGVVIAHGKSRDTEHLYQDVVIGKAVLPENEPIVFAAYEKGITIRDLKGVTQENQAVMQRAVPIQNKSGRIIGILVEERDYSRSLRNKEKLEQMKETTEKFARQSSLFENYPGGIRDENGANGINGVMPDFKEVAVQEMHHRVKNSLQIIASTLNLQARRCQSPEAKEAIMEAISRIGSIAAIHELTENTVDETVSLKDLLQKIANNTKNYVRRDGQNIEILVSGHDMLLEAEKGIKIAIIMNELISNAVIHGLKSTNQGTIKVMVNKGTLYSTISVEDNGTGFPIGHEDQNRGLGLELVTTIVKEKLKGNLKISSERGRSCVSFDFS